MRMERMAALAEQVGRAFVAWRPLAGVRVDGEAGELVLAFVDAARGVKVDVGLALSGLLNPRADAGGCLGLHWFSGRGGEELGEDGACG